MSIEKGILLAGGLGTRLYPATQVINKHLLPVYDKPMIYYPLSTLMLAGIRDVLLITSEHDSPLFESLLEDGRRWGIRISYAIQSSPGGLAEAFLVGESFLAGQPAVLALGDNIFYGSGFTSVLRRVLSRGSGATIFAYPVGDPQRFGVVEIDENSRAVSLEEKPRRPRSSLAVTGLYVYDHRVSGWARQLGRSARGELEITDLNRMYLERGALAVEVLGRGFTWMDAGTTRSYWAASSFVETVQTRQGLRIACPEEIAWRFGYIDDQQLRRLIGEMPTGCGEYGDYLSRLLCGDSADRA